MPAYLVLQFIVSAEMQVGVADKLETNIEHFLDDEYRINATSIFVIMRFHVTARVVDGAIQAAALQRVEYLLVHHGSRFGTKVVQVSKR